MRNNHLEFQLRLVLCQLELMRLSQVEAEGKEYKAPWLKNAGMVMRDASGRFYSKAKSTVEDLEDDGRAQFEAIEKTVRDSATKTKAEINKEFWRISQDTLDSAVDLNPKYADEVLSFMFGKDAEALKKKVANNYRHASSELADEIEGNPFLDLKGDIETLLKGEGKEGQSPKDLVKDLGRAFSLTHRKYKETIEELDNLEGTPQIQALGKAAALSIPIGMYLAATLTAPVAIGTAAGLPLTAIITGAAAGEVAAYGARKALDVAEVENPWVRFGAEFIAAAAVGGIVEAKIPSLRIPAKAAKAVNETAEAAIDDVIEAAIGNEITPLRLVLKDIHTKKSKEVAKMARKYAAGEHQNLTVTHEKLKRSVSPETAKAARETEKMRAENLMKKAKSKSKKEIKMPKDVVESGKADGLKSDFAEFEVDGNTVAVEFRDEILPDGTTTTEIGFEVNDSYNVETPLDPEVAAKIAKKVHKVAQAYISRLEDGVQFKCSAATLDDRVFDRVSAYQAMGFSHPVLGTPGGQQYATVVNGRLVPDSKQYMDNLTSMIKEMAEGERSDSVLVKQYGKEVKGWIKEVAEGKEIPSGLAEAIDHETGAGLAMAQEMQDLISAVRKARGGFIQKIEAAMLGFNHLDLGIAN